MQVILASKSPRRQELLRAVGIENFIVHPAVRPEIADPGWSPEETVCNLAKQKAEEVAAGYDRAALVIAADTLVYLDGTRLGKPKSPAEAAEMLERLAGREHTVYSGVALMHEGRLLADWERTAVRFRSLSDAEIAWYVETGEPMDKAGAYGIQGRGAILIEGICGDYYNVMGLPLCLLHRMCGDMGITLIR